MIYSPPATGFLARVEGFPTGLAGTVGVRILDNNGNAVLARTTVGVTESPAGSGSYIANLAAPNTLGQYTVFWDDGVVSPSTTAAEDLTVTFSVPAVLGGGTAYAALADVQARAGALSNAWTVNSRPSTGDIMTFLGDVAGEIDAILGARGFATPATGNAALALKDVNAAGAMLIALTATYPEGNGPASASKFIDDLRTAYDAAMAALEAGTHPAVVLLEQGNVDSRAGSFWESEPLYGIFPYDPRLDPLSPDANPYTAPTVARGMSL